MSKAVSYSRFRNCFSVQLAILTRDLQGSGVSLGRIGLDNAEGVANAVGVGLHIRMDIEQAQMCADWCVISSFRSCRPNSVDGVVCSAVTYSGTFVGRLQTLQHDCFHRGRVAAKESTTMT